MFDKQLLYVLTILEAVEKIRIYADGFSTPLDFFEANSQMNFNATVNLLIAIGEESKKIDDAKKEALSDIQWSSVVGLRNELSHNYRGVDYHIIWNVIQVHLEKIKAACVEILLQLNIEEDILKAAVSSHYYEHLAYLLDDRA
ncbi:MAG: DUF86 domain-containing protein [Kiritimatiellae bacterium]|jgi:uncharacterized protein with HEPN domain|nr:DUF86 domain-containing protein [Kiritimatiellia bacterium]